MSNSGDRNLLVGVLALQLDFVCREQLIAAMNAWVLDKAKPLEDILLEQGALAEGTHALMVALAKKHLELHGGDAENSLGALSSIGSLTADLRSIGDLQLDATINRITADRDSQDADNTESITIGETTSAGQRFQILRPHAKGGLGAVLIARDTELNREVALKEIHDQFADDSNSRERFLMEAEITGRLEHPGIVPVYGLGQYNDGRPYYAMRFIRGHSLKEAVDDFHAADTPDRDASERVLEFRKLLGRFVDVCDAVEYAHSRGVLHRDLKPRNIMIGKYGETLIVDWGLAKVVGRSAQTERTGEITLRPSSGSGSAETQMGRAVGTPSYMSPEQAEGRLDELGPATDVYSLGATLYYLLTGKPPFDDSGVEQLLQDVRAGNFPRPAEVKSSVPRPLETICVKAMALIPRDRYSTPRAVAEQVERWLADEEVRAESAINKATIDFVCNDLLAHASPDQEPVRDIKLRTVLDNAATSIEERFADQPLVEAAIRLTVGNTYRTLGLDDDAEEHLKRSYDLRVEHSGDEHSATLASMSYLAFLYLNQGRYVEAEPLVEQALETKQRVLGEEHQDTLWSKHQRARLYHARNRLDEAEALYKSVAEASLRTLGEDHEQTLTTIHNLGALYRDQCRYEEAKLLLQRAMESNRRVRGEEHPVTLTSMGNLALLYGVQERYEEAESLYTEVLEISRRVLGEEHLLTLNTMSILAGLYHTLGRSEEAESLWTHVLQAKRRELGEQHPSTVRTVIGLAGLYREQGRFQNAERLLEQALETSRQTIETGVLSSNAYNNHAYILMVLTGVLVDQGSFIAAEMHCRECLAVRERVVPDQWQVFSTKSVLGEALLGQRRYAEAESLLVDGYDGMKRLEETIPMSARMRLNEAVERLVNLYEAWNRFDDAAGWRAELQRRQQDGSVR